MAKVVPAGPFEVCTEHPPLLGQFSRVAPPVLYHTKPTPAPTPDVANSDGTGSSAAVPTLWRKVHRSILFWRSVRDVVQVSLFAPSAVTPGQSTHLVVYLHPPEATASIRTLCRAFHHEAELIAWSYLGVEVARQSTVAVHLSLMYAGVARSLVNVVWRGHPLRLVFDVHVPWESPAGPADGVVTAEQNHCGIGTVNFQLIILPRK
jgi:hypothetical protein